MAQRRFVDPVVSAGPTLTGSGNGTLSVDRLTHFTTAQTYNLTCISKSPSTIFSVVGSLDGPVGLAATGTQFYDEDLKIFLTITQGSTPFEVGDVFTLAVINGTDLNQDNIDDYDEEPQKNFGTGNKGTMSGDNSLRFTDADQFANVTIQAIRLTAAVAGASVLSFRIYDTAPAVAATRTLNGITFTAVTPGASGNSIQIEFVGDAVAGSENVTVSGNLIRIHAQDSISTRAQVATAINASAPALALVSFTVASPSTTITAPVSPTNLTGGVNTKGTLGSETAELVGNEVRVYITSGRSTITAVKAAMDASAPVGAVMTSEVLGSSAQLAYLMTSAAVLSGGTDRQYALNKKELTDAGNFFEGNADLATKDLNVQGSGKVAGTLDVAGAMSLGNFDSGETVGDVQDYINRLIQDQKIALRTADHTKVTWTKPNFLFTADIQIEFADTGITNKIAVSQSPFTVPDGSSIYAVLDRKNTRYITASVGTTVPKDVNAFRLLTRYGDNALLWDNTLLRDGKSVRIGEGGEGGTVKVDLIDPVDTTLPTGASATIDGVAVTEGMFVLFTNLTAAPGSVWKVTGVGTSLVWTQQSVWTNGLLPINGDDVIVIQGAAFARAHGIYDGSAFQFNDRVRYFNGLDYWEVSNLKQVSLTNNLTSNVFAINYAGSENLFVDYSILRNGKKAAGTIIITTDGTTGGTAITSNGAENIPLLGVTFDADILSGQVRLRYTTSNSGFPATMKFVLRRWSDGAGGPGGIPSYSGSTGMPAAGIDTDIQFNDGGSVGADSSLTYSKTAKVLGLNGLQVVGLMSTVIADNTVNGILTSFDASLYPSAIIEYSILRDGNRRTGQIMVATNGTTIGVDEQGVENSDPGVTLAIDLNAGNVEISYSSTATGIAGVFEYSVRRWS